VAAARSLKQFEANKKFQVLVGGGRAKTIVALNLKRKPLDDVRVRRAIAAAIDRKAVIEGAADGFGVPIGSYYVPGAPGYVDTTALNPYDPAKARALLHQAGKDLAAAGTDLKLPPTPYARQGGEVVAAMLAKVGINAKIENVEWAQWLSGVYGQKAYDLTVISHVEPLDFGNFARPNYYWGYESAEFNALWARIQATPAADERNKLMADAQRLVAQDAVSVLPVPADLDHGGQRPAQGAVEGHAAVCQRPGRAELAVGLAFSVAFQRGAQRCTAAVLGCGGRSHRCAASAHASRCLQLGPAPSAGG
jgi:peptide/nickel transport system substrate-binding protein